MAEDTWCLMSRQPRVIRIAFGQLPHGVDVVRQDNHRIDGKRMNGLDGPNRTPQQIHARRAIE
jgi:hypothetical protein